ncbi:hypothetical protein ACOSQ4_022521 [Xanthoceras sorbifolium]
MGAMKINPKGNVALRFGGWLRAGSQEISGQNEQASQVVRSSLVNPLFNYGNCLKANVGAGRGEAMLKMDNTAMVNPSVSSLVLEVNSMCEDLVSGDEFQQAGVTLGSADQVVFVVNKDQVSEAVQLGLKRTRWKRWA